ncbi:MAG: hypothetical protein LUE98_19410 [Tannerellaceae bacterium]|nr:hypothetical protein [Tannerellaceae bacterium]
MDNNLIYSLVKEIKPLECQFLGEQKVKLIIDNVNNKNKAIEALQENDGLYHFGENIELLACILAAAQTLIALCALALQINASRRDNSEREEMAEKIVEALSKVEHLEEEKKKRLSDILKAKLPL